LDALGQEHFGGVGFRDRGHIDVDLEFHPDFHPNKPFFDAAFNAIDFGKKQIDQSSAKENRNHDITTVQNLLGPSVKVMAPAARSSGRRLCDSRSSNRRRGSSTLSTTSFFSRAACKRPARSSSSRRFSTSDSR
jgi:hypothetical protein